VRILEAVPLPWPASAVTLGLQALFLGLSGHRAKAKSNYRKLKVARAAGGWLGAFVPAAQLSLAALGAGEPDVAVGWLRESITTEHDPIMAWVNVLPFNRHLYSHKGFQDLVRTVLKVELLAKDPPQKRRAGV
jgi:hypothetical protein